MKYQQKQPLSQRNKFGQCEYFENSKIHLQKRLSIDQKPNMKYRSFDSLKKQRKSTKFSKKTDEQTIYSFKKKNNLKKLLEKTNIQKLGSNFRKKIKCNNNQTQLSKFPFQEDGKEQENKTKCDWKGFTISKKIQIFFQSISILQFLISIFFFGVGLVFSQFNQTLSFKVFELISIMVLMMEIFLGIFAQKIILDQKLSRIRQIFIHYAKEMFIIDVLCLLIFFADYFNNWEGIKVLRIIFFLKTKQFLGKIGELEIFFLKSFDREQYYRVVKVFLTNFMLAHIIAVLYVIMAKMNESNWMNSLDIENKDWSQKYAFAYYWAMSTMLGFGNATPSNAQQAILISIIECFSYIFLAYIINYVGILLTNISKKNEDKQNKLRTARRLSEQNHVSEQLFSKICNYIKLTDSMQKSFTFQNDQNFLSSLPADISEDFLKESNLNIFQNVLLFKDFTKKILITLSQKISMKIAHPNQILISNKKNDYFMILQKGEILQYSIHFEDSCKKKFQNTLKVKQKKKSIIFNLKQIMFHDLNSVRFNVKSTDFSMVALLNYQETIQIISKCSYDYQQFCRIRDQQRIILNEFQIIGCQFCETKHSGLRCPRLHYVPFHNLVIFRYLKKYNLQKNQRKQFRRGTWKRNMLKALLIYKQIYKSIQSIIFSQKMIEQQKKSNAEQIFDKELTLLERRKGDEQSTLLIQQRYTKQIKKTVNDMKLLLEEYLQIKNGDQIFNFWELELDIVHDYKFYFPNFNSSNFKHFGLKTFDTRKNSIVIANNFLKVKKMMSKNREDLILEASQPTEENQEFMNMFPDDQ